MRWKKTAAIFLTGQAITTFGSSLAQYAVSWHILLRTLSGAAISAATIAATVPALVIPLFAGVLADKFNRKAIINISDATVAAATLVMAILFSAGLDFVWMLIACIVVRAVGQSAQAPAASSLLPQLVPPENLTRVNGISATVQSLIAFTAPAISGALILVAPIQNILYIDVATAAVGICALAFFVKVPDLKRDENSPSGGIFRDMREGLQYAWSHGFIRKIILFAVAFNMLASPLMMLAPLFSARAFGQETWRLPALQMSASVGTLLGGALIGVGIGFKNKSATAAAAIGMFGLAVIGMYAAGNFWAMLVFLALVGLSVSAFNVPMTTILQEKTDEKYMGRIFSVLSTLASAFTPVGIAILGPMSDRVDMRLIFLAAGIAIVFMAAAFIGSRELREAGGPAR